ncbi:MAG: hypothetical protein AMS18_01445 [Gemmatimonas sp. SG8_17]|nr:MAG: hypothetical protein AMS18_01445 [Gemmatimonas sp. SG8_17]
MFRLSILGSFAALSFAIVLHAGCSNGGNGDGEQPRALSLDGDTSVPATGGSAIAVDDGRGLASIVSSMLEALVADLEAPADAAASKLLVDEALPLCLVGGTALLTGELIIGREGEAEIIFEDCEGSPLSSTATNGRLQLSASTSFTPDIGGTGVLSVSGRGVLAGLGDGDDFTIDPGTIFTGGFGVEAIIPVEFGPAMQATGIERLRLLGASSDPPPNTIRVQDTEGSLELGCFELALADITFDPPSIGPLTLDGVLNVDGAVWTVSSDDIGFDDWSAGAAIPTSGGFTLTSGDPTGCFGTVTGDGSRATATFQSGGNVLIDTVNLPECYECTEAWEDLLQVLRSTVAPQCPPTSCDNNPPVINYVAWEYTGGCTGFGDTELTITISAYDPEGGALSYTGNVVSCQTPIAITSGAPRVEQTLTDCFSGTIESVEVTVEDSAGATDSISATWESAPCEERCEEGEQDDLIREECPVPWPED